jgi:epoxyqueuosine reductase
LRHKDLRNLHELAARAFDALARGRRRADHGPVDATRLALELALESGFDLAGVAPLGPPPDLERLDAWLAAGRNAGLTWMARDRDRIADPRGLLPRGRAMLVLGLGHSRPAPALPDGTRVARYALGRDYHNVVGRMLRKLRSRLVEAGLFARDQPFRKIVDAGPLMERSHAAQAGLGFASKAANLLHPRFGPWFFLGELLVERELDPTPTPPAGSCGTCRLCLDACPTDAIVAPGVVDARRCISHLTIEHEGPVPDSLRALLGGWAFGCVVCSEVCPWGR